MSKVNDSILKIRCHTSLIINHYLNRTVPEINIHKSVIIIAAFLPCYYSLWEEQSSNTQRHILSFLIQKIVVEILNYHSCFEPAVVVPLDMNRLQSIQPRLEILYSNCLKEVFHFPPASKYVSLSCLNCCSIFCL